MSLAPLLAGVAWTLPNASRLWHESIMHGRLHGLVDEEGRIIPAFLSTGEVAALFGWTRKTFTQKCPLLVRGGFPEKDPIVGKWHRASVEAWIASRGAEEQFTQRHRGTSWINLDAA